MVALFIMGMIATLVIAELIAGKFEGRKLNVVTPQPATRLSLTVPPDGIQFHRGHTWVREAADGVLVGLDNFAKTIVGKPEEVRIPVAGTRIMQGEPAWTIRRGGRDITMLAPINGEVVAVNERATKDPSVIESDPYDAGWLVKVRPDNFRADRRNLLDGSLAGHWMDESYNRLSRIFSPELGVVMNDGGELMSGVIDSLEPEQVEQALQEFFLVETRNNTEE